MQTEPLGCKPDHRDGGPGAQPPAGGVGGLAPHSDAITGNGERTPRANVPYPVELRGIEPLTYSMRTSRATNCATAPVAQTLAGGHSPTARR
jgi:hypothetical protein